MGQTIRKGSDESGLVSQTRRITNLFTFETIGIDKIGERDGDIALHGVYHDEKMIVKDKHRIDERGNQLPPSIRIIAVILRHLFQEEQDSVAIQQLRSGQVYLRNGCAELLRCILQRLEPDRGGRIPDTILDSIVDI